MLKGSWKMVKTLANPCCHSLMSISCRSELQSHYSALTQAKLPTQPTAGKRLRFARKAVEPGANASYSNSCGSHGWEMPKFSNCPKESSKQVLWLMHRQRDCGKGFLSVLGDPLHHSQQSWRLMLAVGRGGCSSRRQPELSLAQQFFWVTPLIWAGWLVADNTWGNDSRKTQWKGKTKKQTGLAMRRKYSHPQGMLHSRGRGDKPSPEGTGHRGSFPGSRLVAQSLTSFCSGTEKKKCIPIVSLGRSQRSSNPASTALLEHQSSDNDRDFFKVQCYQPQLWTKLLIFLFLRYPTNVYVDSEISIPTKCLPKLSQGQTFSKYFSWAQQTGIPHNTCNPASKALRWCPVAVLWGKLKVWALSIILAGEGSPPDPPRVSHPKGDPLAGSVHPQPG